MKNIKNKINKRKFELTVIFLALILIGLIKLLTTVSAEDNSSIPSLFYNDTLFVYSMPGSNYYLPLEQIDGFIISLSVWLDT